MSDLSLYTYFRSSASYRVRIALHWKKLAFDSHYVHLVRDGGENWKPRYLDINPQGLVPVLEHEGEYLSQSLAILEYLEEHFPQPPLLPSDPVRRARVRALANIIACEVQPLNNLRVLAYLREQLGASEDAIKYWHCHWVAEGLKAFQALLPGQAHDFCVGSQPTLADVCLIPQLYNARRFSCDLTQFPRLVEIDRHCNDLPAFKAAAPEQQGDAE